VRIFDTDHRGVARGFLDSRTDIQLKRGENVSCLDWISVSDGGKKRKRVTGTAGVGDLIVGLTNGKIYVAEQGVGEIVRTLSGHTALVSSWFGEDEKGWSCALDGKIKCWDYKSGS